MSFSDVFISYRRKNIEFVKEFEGALRATGREIWVDWEDIPPGSTDFTADIANGIEQSDAFIAILSPEYLDSEYCMNELDFAVKSHKRIVPVVMTKFEGRPIPAAISHINWVYFVEHAGQANEFDSAFKKVIEALESDQEHTRIHTRLFQRAKEWDASKRDTSFLLKGSELSEAEAWLSTSASKNPHPLPLHSEYVLTSRKHQIGQQRRLLAWVSAALAITIIFAVLAIFFAITANRLALEATSFALAASARDQVRTDQTLALALAIEANKIDNPDMQSQKTLADIAYTPGLRRVVQEHTDAVTSIVYSPDGQSVVTVSDDGRVLIWNAADATVRGELIDQEGRVADVAFHPNGETFATGSTDGSVIIWDTETQDQLFTLRDHMMAVEAVAYSPDGTYFASASDDTTVFLYDTETYQILKIFEEGHTDLVFTIAFSPDERFLVSGGYDNNIVVWDVTTYRKVQTIDRSAQGHNAVISSVIFDSTLPEVGEMCFFSASEDFEMKRWCLPMGGGRFVLRDVFRVHTDRINDLTLTNDNSLLVSVSSDQNIVISNVDTKAIERTLTGHTAAVLALALSPDGSTLYTGGQDGNVYQWDMINGAVRTRYERIAEGVARTAAMTSDGRYALNSITDIIDSPDGTYQADQVAVYDADTGKHERNLVEPRQDIRDIEITPDNKTVIVASWDYFAPLTLYDFESGEVIENQRFIEGENIEVYVDDIDLSSDGKLLAIAYNYFDPDTEASKTYAAVWDLENSEIIASFEEDALSEDNLIAAVAFSPDNTALLYGSGSHEVILRDIASGQILAQFAGPEDLINSVDFSPDGTKVAAGSFDKVTYVWEVATRVRLSRQTSGAAVLKVAFNPAGTLLMTASADKNITLYDTITYQPVRTYREHTGDVTDARFVMNGAEILSSGLDGFTLRWRIDTLDDLQAWIQPNRWLREFSCNERRIYRLEECA